MTAEMSSSWAAVEQLARPKVWSTWHSTSLSPRWSKTSAVKQFQPISSATSVLLPNSSEMHCLASIPVDFLPPLPRPMFSMRSVRNVSWSRTALQRGNWHLMPMGTQLRSNSTKFRNSSVSKLVTRPMQFLLACTMRLKLRRLRASEARFCRRDSTKRTSAGSDKDVFPSRSTSSKPASSHITPKTNKSSSVMALPFASNFKEWPVTKGMVLGTTPLLWHARKYRLVGDSVRAVVDLVAPTHGAVKRSWMGGSCFHRSGKLSPGE
mmetsp:Transcript_76783/g.213372  ORF Transcript_76783/g.213372 Transcript_76783/m.213372 type:complete len:265 (-) Transcript_76783:440-1234(-)